MKPTGFHARTWRPHPARRSHLPAGGLALLAGLALLVAAPAALAYSTGPLDGYTGAPGEGNCTACHTSFPLNSGAGSLVVDGFPATYTPGTTYDLVVRLSDPDAVRWGFELTVIDAGGQAAGAPANVNASTQLSTAAITGRIYAKHTLAGTQVGQTLQGSWPLQWTAPAAGAGGVSLYVAGNAANNGNLSLGDRIYTASFASAEGAIAAAPDLLAAASLSGFPNPFNPAITIRLRLAADADVRVTVHDVAGRRVGTLLAAALAAGDHDLRWDGRSDAGVAMPSGLYFARVVDAGGRALARPLKMVLAK